MKNRIFQFMQSEGLNAFRFAETLEVQPSSISHILSGRNKPSFDFIEKLLSKYPKLNPDWLLLGQGPMYRKVEELNNKSDSVTENSGLFSGQLGNTQNKENDTIVTNVKTFDNDDFMLESIHEEKQIEKIIILYSDGTFRDFRK